MADAWQQLEQFVEAGHNADRALAPAWLASLDDGALDVLIDRRKDTKRMLGALAAVRGWKGPVDDARQLIRERETERARARLRVHQGGGQPSPRDAVIPHLSFGVRDGLPKSSMRNVVRVLEHDRRWEGAIRRNEFTGNVDWRGAPLSDEHIRRLVVWLDDEYAMTCTTSLVHDGISHVADDHKYHPVRDYLNGLEWDRKRRAHRLWSEYAGATRNRKLIEAVADRFLISCVARVFKPGCKVDTVPILQGSQGTQKSTFIQALAGSEWYRDTDIDPHGKDAYQQIAGVWLYEVPEIEKWNQRKDQATIKGFLTSQTDSYRPPYARCIVQQPRTCVFVGTTNEDEFLADPTGARRYWPITVGRLDIEGLERDRDQIWAEAVSLYHASVQWWLDDEESAMLVEAQESYTESDPWLDHVIAWLDSNKDRYTDGLAFGELMNGLVDVGQQGRVSTQRVRAILGSLGWKKGDQKVTLKNGSRVWRWTKS